MKHDAIFSRIHLLKQQPKQGMADPEYRTPGQAANERLNADLKDLAADAAKAVKQIASAYKDVYDTVNTSNLSLQTGISKLAGVFDSYASAITAVIKEATFLEQRNKSLNVSLGINSKIAANLGEAYDNLAESLGTGGEQIRQYGINLNKILPGMSKMIANVGETGKVFKKGFNEQLLGANQFLTEHIKLTGDAANSYQLYAAGAGKNSLEQLTATQRWADSFDEATGLAGSFSGIVSDIADLGADIQTTYNKMPGSLEKSIVKAKLLGTSFAKIEAMATKMLNIEESVGAELEYQLLSGKRLVDQDGNSITEKLRIAKLSGNAEDQVKAMNDLLSTQGDVLDGNNYYAKQQLENLTGFTVAELTRQRQMQKLMEQGGMDKARIEKFMEMDPTSFTTALADVKDENTATLLSELKKNASLKTTDQKLEDFLDMKRTVGIIDMSGRDGETKLGNNQANLIGGAAMDVENAKGAIGGYGANFLKKEVAQILGSTQLASATFTATKKPIDDLVTAVPVLNGHLSKLSSTIGQLIKTVGGAVLKGGATEKKPDATPTDGILVNDAMIQFHPADKFATVSNGSALLASTERGKLDSAVNTLTGKNSGGVAVVDPAPIAAAIMASMRNMKVEVNYDVTAAASAANFKFNQGING
jgi:hypothetical protein